MSSPAKKRSTLRLDAARTGPARVADAVVPPALKESVTTKELRRRIVVGQLPPDFEVRPDDATATVHASTVRAVFRLLWKASHVELVIAETDPALSKWSDLAELVARENIPGELRIIGHDGRQVFRGTIGPDPSAPMRRSFGAN